MAQFVTIVDKLSTWFGKAFAWCIMIMIVGVSYDVMVTKLFNSATNWAYEITYMMYGTLFMMAGAYTLSRDSHVRADFLYRNWSPRKQAVVELILYPVFFFPAILALIFYGWFQAQRAWRIGEIAISSPTGIPIYQYRTIIPLAGTLLLLQGIAQMFRCVLCLQTGEWMRARDDVEETEKLLIDEKAREALQHSGEAVDVPTPDEAGLTGGRK
ncbi:MAG: TRAP transporter small permease subunit [Bauldia sp.]